MRVSLAHPPASASQQYFRSHSLFARWLNIERGGISLGGQRFALEFQTVGDGSAATQVTNATAHALRASISAHFAAGGFSSDLTNLSAKQSYADGKVSPCVPHVPTREPFA